MAMASKSLRDAFVDIIIARWIGCFGTEGAEAEPGLLKLTVSGWRILTTAGAFVPDNDGC